MLPDIDIDNYISSARPKFEDYLTRLVAVPTVSADPAHASDIARGAELAKTYLEEAGFVVEIIATAGHPVVVGRLVQDPSYPTVTIYNHLDVQPADREAWTSDPFILKIEGDNYVGRGATDDKGPALTALMAIRYATGKIPLNFTVLWELEEETGSPHFEEFMQAQADRLPTGSVLVSDTIWTAPGRPTVDYGLRGMITFEVRIRTATQDVHSGLAGGVARNPLGELSQIIAECYDPLTGHVKIPGFYDHITPPTEDELSDFLASGFDLGEFTKAHGLLLTRTEDAREAVARIMAEPTFEIHGIVGGYTGPGVKTVIPPVASAKLSTRLVPGQAPEHIFNLIKAFIGHVNPHAEIIMENSLPAYLGEFSGPHAAAARTAIEYAFGVAPAFVREGGSIGSVLTMQQALKAPVVLMGLSLPGHGYHAPNEHFDWGQASGGIKLFARYFSEIAKLKPTT